MFRDTSVEINGKQMLTEFNRQETADKQCVNLLTYVCACVCVAIIQMTKWPKLPEEMPFTLISSFVCKDNCINRLSCCSLSDSKWHTETSFEDHTSYEYLLNVNLFIPY